MDGLLSDNRDGVLECADTRNGDAHRIAGFERERIVRDDPRARQQHRAVREYLRAEQILDELREPSFDLSGPRLAGKHRFASTLDLELNAPLPHVVFRGPDDDPWADGARRGVGLRLRQIEQGLALDVAGAHVVADG